METMDWAERFSGIGGRAHMSAWDRFTENRLVFGVPYLTIVPLGVITLALLRHCIYSLMKPIALRITNNGYKEPLTPAGRRASHADIANKMMRYMWHFLFYVLETVWIIKLCRQAPFFHFPYDPRILIDCVVEDLWGIRFDTLTLAPIGESREVNTTWCSEMHLMLVVQMSWYTHNFVADVLRDRYRHDFLLMVAHHVVATLLIVLSFVADCHRLALCVLVPMEIMDLILYGSKMFHLFSSTLDGKPKAEKWRLRQTMVLCVVTSSWFVLRMVLFGSVCLTALYTLITRGSTMFGGAVPRPILIIVVMLQINLTLQTTWQYKITKMSFAAIRDGHFTDRLFNSHKEESTKIE